MTLGPIRCVTVCVPDLARAIGSYEQYLNYECTHRYRLSDAQADHFGAPGLAGAAVGLLRPASKADFLFRFIEQPLPSGYLALGTYGWNASELIVRDVDALAERLAGSPFRVIGPPADLSFSDAIRAMQVVGPAEEVLYLTMVKEPLAEFDLPQPASDIDRVFIVVLGGAEMTRIKRFYRRQLGVPEAPVMEARISVLSNAHGLPEETLHPICALPLAGKSLIEVDVFPPTAVGRQREPGLLPSAMAIVSFASTELPTALPRGHFQAAPYDGRPSVLLQGAAGELIELIQA